jgi:hypothetical protein
MTESDALAAVQNRLQTEFLEHDTDQVRTAVERAEAHFAQSTVRDFVPLLVERRARADLRHS